MLASASPRRAMLLKQMNLEFKIDPSDFNEEFDIADGPKKIVQQLATKKGIEVSKRHKKSLIIAADTMVFLYGRHLGKPADLEEAKTMLKKLSSETHYVYTGVFTALTDKNFQIETSFTFFERTKVTFTTLTDREIDSYIKTEEPFDKAGSYGIQDDLGALFIENIEGDYYNVVGFPLHLFYQKLKQNLPEISNKLFFTEK